MIKLFADFSTPVGGRGARCVRQAGIFKPDANLSASTLYWSRSRDSATWLEMCKRDLQSFFETLDTVRRRFSDCIDGKEVFTRRPIINITITPLVPGRRHLGCFEVEVRPPSRALSRITESSTSAAGGSLEVGPHKVAVQVRPCGQRK